MFGRMPSLGAVNIARELIRPSPRGGRKGGLPEHVQAITLDDVQTHWKRYYKPRNAILVLAGAVDEASARQAVIAHFARLAAGETIAEPGEPGTPQTGAIRELSVRSLQPQAGPVACLAYAAPEPGSELYAPFLVLVARFCAASAQPGAGGGTDRPSVYFPLLEDPAVLGVSVTAKPGETAAAAIARLESFVADTISPPLRGRRGRVGAPDTSRFSWEPPTYRISPSAEPVRFGAFPGPARAAWSRPGQTRPCPGLSDRTRPSPRRRSRSSPRPVMPRQSSRPRSDGDSYEPPRRLSKKLG